MLRFTPLAIVAALVLVVVLRAVGVLDPSIATLLCLVLAAVALLAGMLRSARRRRERG